MSNPRGVPKGSRRIPDAFRGRVARRIQQVMGPYVKGHDSFTEFCRETSRDFDVHPNTIKNWYEGNCLPTILNLVRVADYYEVSVDYLLGRTAVKELAHVLLKLHGIKVAA